MTDRIKLGEKVIGSTGSGRYGTRQVIGEYAGQVDKNVYLVRVERRLLGQPYVDCERCWKVGRVKGD